MKPKLRKQIIMDNLAARACTWDSAREALAREIVEAFLHTRLEDGVGFYEANARDDYLDRTDWAEYQRRRALDEREHWENVLFLASDGTLPPGFYPGSAFTFMDGAGRAFALPCYLLWELQGHYFGSLDFWLKDSYYTDALPLNRAQKRIVFRTVRFLRDQAFASNDDVLFDEWEKVIAHLQSVWADDLA